MLTSKLCGSSCGLFKKIAGTMPGVHMSNVGFFGKLFQRGGRNRNNPVIFIPF
jgi:hypothetical protein